jgi:hypothetical protein
MQYVASSSGGGVAASRQMFDTTLQQRMPQYQPQPSHLLNSLPLLPSSAMMPQHHPQHSDVQLEMFSMGTQPGQMLGHPCNLPQQPQGVILGPDSSLHLFKHFESEAVWNVPSNSYACGHMAYMPCEAAKSLVPSDMQQGFSALGSQIWGGA